MDASLGEGRFGMAEETGRGINEIAKLAERIRIGYGEAAGQYLQSGILKAKYLDTSVLAAAYKLRIPVTVHLAVGTDIPHMHPAADGAALGAASYTDFRLFCALVEKMDAGIENRSGCDIRREKSKERSKGFAITGHHELLLPLVAAALAGGWPRESKRGRS